MCTCLHKTIIHSPKKTRFMSYVMGWQCRLAGLWAAVNRAECDVSTAVLISNCDDIIGKYRSKINETKFQPLSLNSSEYSVCNVNKDLVYSIYFGMQTWVCTVPICRPWPRFRSLSNQPPTSACWGHCDSENTPTKFMPDTWIRTNLSFIQSFPFIVATSIITLWYCPARFNTGLPPAL